MSEKSLSKNSIYYLIYSVLNVLFPLITGIYVARILLPSLIGEVAYALNISSYFVILAFLGIPTYGMREIAKHRDDKEKTKKIHSELFVINAFSTGISLLLYFVLVFVVPSFRNHLLLYSITGLSIATNFLNNSWLFQGLEEFKYISIRNIVFKIILFLLLILFVKKENDYIAYALIATIGSVGAYFLNIIYAKRKIGFTLKGLELKKHLKPIFFLLAVNIAIEIYTLVDTTMIGIFCDKSHVAYYSYGSKIYKVLLQIVNSFTVVIIPRLSFYYKNNNFKDFNTLLTKTLKVLLLISVPAIIGIQFVSDFLIVKVYGEQYVNSISVIKILCFNLLISPVGYLLGSRVLLASNKELKMIFAVGIGCVTNLVGNFLLIQLFQEVGASLASVISETIVAVVYLLLSHKIFKLNSMRKFTTQLMLSSIFMCLFLFFLNNHLSTSWIKLFVQIFGAVSIYCCSLLLLREDTTMSIFKRLICKFKLKNN